MAAPKIVNTYSQLARAGGGVAISWHPHEPRMVQPAAWVVWRVGTKGELIRLVEGGPWYHRGAKHFTPFGTTKAEALEQAKAWVAAQGLYDGPWVRNRMHDYVPAHINKQFPLPKKGG